MSVRVLTLNVWNTDGPTQRQKRLRDAIGDLRPDLVSLQEVVRTHDLDQLGDLLDGLDMFATHDTELISGETWGNAIASRWKPRSVEGHRLPSDVPGPTALAAIVPLPIDVDILFLGVKPSYRFTDEALRCQQARAIAGLEETLRSPAPSIIAGDFDATPDSACMRYYTGLAPLDGSSVHFRDAWAIAGDGTEGHTWTTDNPYVASVESSGWIQAPHHRRIDYVLAGSPEQHPAVRSRITSSQVVMNTDPFPSDHYGVVAELELEIAP